MRRAPDSRDLLLVHMRTVECVQIKAMRIAELLATNRRRGSLTQKTFARRLGISRATLTRIENCSQNATIRTLERIAKALRCDIGELFENTDAKRK